MVHPALAPLPPSKLNFRIIDASLERNFPKPCYDHTSQCPSAEYCLERNSLKLHHAKITLATLERKLQLPYDDSKYSDANLPEPVKCFWHGVPCTSEYSCLLATTRHINQAHAIIIYLQRKTEQFDSERMGQSYGTKNQNGNTSHRPIIGYVATEGATVHEMLHR